MPKYNVSIFYHGSFNAEIDAESEQQAKEIARNKADNMSSDEFLNAIEIIENGTDVYEIN